MTQSLEINEEPLSGSSPTATQPEAGNADMRLEDDINTVYSIFSKSQKHYIVFLVAFAAWFSTLSSFIYFPAITALARDLHTTVENINLTVTSYMIISGVIPSIVGDSADMLGRRPVFIVTLAVYLVANVGLAVQGSFLSLLLLRMLQSAGISGMQRIFHKLIPGIEQIHSPRQGHLLLLMARLRMLQARHRGVHITNTAPSFGPVLGGSLIACKGWRWIFWFLSIASGVCLTAIIIFLPETARNVVGNGSTPVREKARLRSIFYPLVVAVAAIVGYGWSIEAKAHVSVPLILQFFMGSAIQGYFTILNTLLIDLHPQSPSTAQASAKKGHGLETSKNLEIVNQPQEELIAAIVVGVAMKWMQPTQETPADRHKCQVKELEVMGVYADGLI
ncbi:hypothetical protein FGG08_004759 [Glutinoglossum americanum]|uniref:Major facilitator superfamily (MFS) profile domain-containing protein n=1 Tax=Glutinoglossum americanum TaxID=1670608 RepID=A0A9P8I1Q3_9PEZI|nr:hypothetical protein FGG08_004759 [Glutinoglossum americanum]